MPKKFNTGVHLICLENAKLLKELGFKIFCTFSYWEGGLELSHGYPLKNGNTSQRNYFKYPRYYAPSQTLLTKWLRDVHNIHINQRYDFDKKIYIMHSCIWEEVETDKIDSITSNSYELCLEKLLNQILHYLVTRKNIKSLKKL